MIIIATPTLAPHDAVGNDVRIQHRVLLEAGAEARIFCENFVEDGYSRPYLFEKADLQKLLKDPSVTLIYHHSIYWELGLNLLKEARCRVIVKYHNITPPEFFAPYNPHYAHICHLGRLQTAEIVKLPELIFWADSTFNAEELRSLGAKEVSVLPPFHLLEDFDEVHLDLSLADSLLDSRLHLLFVGRVVPNKGHIHLLEVLRRYLTFYDSSVVLHLVGALDPWLNSYFNYLQALISHAGLDSHVIFHGKVSFPQLYTFYSCCHVFLLLSDHEGFCVPILEAQKLNLPIVAHASCAIPETLGPNQLLFPERDYLHLTCALSVLWQNSSYRLYLAEEGKKNFSRFSFSRLREKFLTLLPLKF